MARVPHSGAPSRFACRGGRDTSDWFPTPMNWFVSLMVALISGVTGLFLAGFIANACVAWYHVSSREGAAGYFVIFLALGGGIFGFLIGLIMARLVAANLGAGFGKELGGALGVVLLMAGISALLCRLLGDVPPEIDGRDLDLEVEFRFPNTFSSNQPPTATGEWDYTFASWSGNAPRRSAYGKILNEAARFEHGHWIVPTTVGLFTERGERSVTIAPRNAREAFGFRLPLPRRPGKEFLEWSEWLPRQQTDGQPWPADKMSCRFRVQKTVPPPPPQSAEETKAEEAAKREAEFAAIPGTAPVEAWFAYLAYEQPQTQRALQLIAGRPHLVAELRPLILGEDAKQAHAALHCISLLPEPRKEFIPVLQEAGEMIAEGIRKFNQTPKEKDPNFELAVDPTTRFYGWLPAVKALREKCGGDFTPELKTILELSRVRPESHCMREDICRVASFYLHTWAGVEPLPTDPKPR